MACKITALCPGVKISRYLQLLEMDVFNGEAISKLLREEEKNETFYREGQYLKIVSTSDRSTSYEYLLQVKNLFQRMLPKMPREYILRQVFDGKHCSLVLNTSDHQIVGAVCYRPNFGRGFVEIVFLAIDSSYHISGYGTFLFGCFKEVCKMQLVQYFQVGEKYKEEDRIIADLGILDTQASASERPRVQSDAQSPEAEKANVGVGDLAGEETASDFWPAGLGIGVSAPQPGRAVPCGAPRYTNETSLYMLTYADNSAIGFFKKQGFTSRPVSSNWIGYIKDYDGGTLMEGKIHKQINYLRKSEVVRSMHAKIFEKMKDINDYHVVRGSSDIEMVRAAYRDELNVRARTSEEFLHDFIFFLICNLQSSSSAWPFLQPVDTAMVPDYLDVIEKPMDLSTISLKHKERAYTSLRDLADDVHLMARNCLIYNDPSTPYYKCGVGIRAAFDGMIGKYSEVIRHWGYDY